MTAASQAYVLDAVIITTAMLASTNVPETVALYSAATTYGIGDRVRSDATHKIYESQKASNIGKDPTDINNQVGASIWWLEISATNPWKVFDSTSASQTVGTSPMTYVLRPGVINGLYLAKLDATGLTITIKDAPGGTVIFTATSTLEGSAPGDYYEFFYDRFIPKTDFILTDLVPYSNAEITITLTNTSGTVKCGLITVGDFKPIGQTLFDPEAEPKSYSRIILDDYGQAKIARRNAGVNLSFVTEVAAEDGNSVLDTITKLLDVSTVWVGSVDDEYAGLRTFGLGSARLAYSSPRKRKLTVRVNGLS